VVFRAVEHHCVAGKAEGGLIDGGIRNPSRSDAATAAARVLARFVLILVAGV
jgi:hypothetical protein